MLRPKLRPVERVVVPDEVHGQAVVLRDTEGVAPRSLVVPGPLAAVVLRFDGSRSVERIAAEATVALRRPVATSLVSRLARELDEGLMLDSPRFRAARRAQVEAFRASPRRPARHAGGAYHGNPGELDRFIRDECLSQAEASTSRPNGKRMAALCAPHMDLWRAAVGYGHAYAALGAALDDEADTFVLLGTCHAPMRTPFAVCAKSFETPLGSLHPETALLDELARRSRFDVREEEYLHKAEHSLEFQCVFLRQLLAARRGRAASEARIVPVLCGLGAAQANGDDPRGDALAESFLSALAEIVARLGRRAVVVAGADFAHVGPRFGDGAPLDEAGRAKLRRRDLESVELAGRADAPGFFEHVVEDLDTRRVCGVAPIYAMLRVMDGVKETKLLHYDQCVDPDEGSIVSHASMGFYR